MTQALDYLGNHWLALLLLVLAVVLGALGGVRFRRGLATALPWLLPAAALVLLTAGSLALPAKIALWLTIGAAAAFFVLLLIVILTSQWWPPLAYAVGALLLLGLGGLCVARVQNGLTEVYFFVRSLEIVDPRWLLLLLLVPLIIWLGFRSLAGLGPVRRWVVIGLCCSLVILLALALTEMRADYQGDQTTVIFLVDCSASIPDTAHPVNQTFVNTMAEMRKSDKVQVGVIYFGRQPRIVRSPTDTRLLNISSEEARRNVDPNATDIASAIKLAIATFPKGSSKRIVLISDGNENLGSAEKEALEAQAKGIQIDVVPLGAEHRKENEVLIDSITTSKPKKGAPLLIEVTLKSYNPNLVRGTLTLKRQQGGQLVPVKGITPDKGSPRKVTLKQGLNLPPEEFVEPPDQDEGEGTTYVAEFTPEELIDPDTHRLLAQGKPQEVLPGDLPENNIATTHVVARRNKQNLLLVENVKDELKPLEDSLPTDKNPNAKTIKYASTRITVGSLPTEEGPLTRYLSDYDCVVLGNLMATQLNDAQQKILKSNTRDQGCGLVMIGGLNGYGVGGWQGAPLTDALPVDPDIKSFRVQGKVGLVLIMHATEMPKGSYWEKQIAKMAIKELAPTDEIGILYFDWATSKFAIPFGPIGDDKEAVNDKIEAMTTGDTQDFDPALQKAYDALSDKNKQFAARHVILISDGDPRQADPNMLPKFAAAKITITTIGVATHDAPMEQNLGNIAKATGGRFYNVKNPNALPAIYLKETRMISQDFIYREPFLPLLERAGPTQKLNPPAKGQELGGFVRTTPKPSGVTVAMTSPKLAGIEFPILAYWQYGLGRSVAYTSGADTALDPQQKPTPLSAGLWYKTGYYGQFWEQVVEWSLRPAETGHLTMTTEKTPDGKVRIIVVASVPDEKQPDKQILVNNLHIEGGVTTPETKEEDKGLLVPKFKQTKHGTYEAEIKAEEGGSYFINVVAKQKVGDTWQFFDTRRDALTIRPKELVEVESRPALLERLRELTGGTTYREGQLQDLYKDAVFSGKVHFDTEEETAKVKARLGEAPANAGKEFTQLAEPLAREVFRAGPPPPKTGQPIWYWLVFAAGLLLLCSVAVRRISIEPASVVTAAKNGWARLRGRTVAVGPTQEFFERLRSRKAQVGQSVERGRAERRFEGPTTPVAPPPGAAASSPPSRPQPPARPAAAPPAGEDAGDFGSRLLRAKKKIWEEREKDKDKDKDK